jgi:hypothetical protein
LRPLRVLGGERGSQRYRVTAPEWTLESETLSLYSTAYRPAQTIPSTYTRQLHTSTGVLHSILRLVTAPNNLRTTSPERFKADRYGRYSPEFGSWGDHASCDVYAECLYRCIGETIMYRPPVTARANIFSITSSNRRWHVQTPVPTSSSTSPKQNKRFVSFPAVAFEASLNVVSKSKYSIRNHPRSNNRPRRSRRIPLRGLCT